MLATLGAPSVEALFDDIPRALRDQVSCQTLPAQGMSEAALQQLFSQAAARNTGVGMQCFLGGGSYPRFIPAAVHAIAGRSEFYTAYTPYQPEVSQGTLQAGFEFQTMIAALSGMDAANATVYDGATAVAEAALMALRATRRTRIAVADGLNPDYAAVLTTYLQAGRKHLEESASAVFDRFDPADDASLSGLNGAQTAALIIQAPDYFGRLLLSPRAQAARAFCQAHGALLIIVADPVSLGLLLPPGAYGADIVVGDLQPLGNSMNFGGPTGGYMACKKALIRQLPGRLIGRARDVKGRPCYTLTLQTREQHIRREKAASNICTNQALNALRAAAYLALMGPVGLREVAERSVQRAHRLADALTAIPGVTLRYPDRPFFSEFVLRLQRPAGEALTFLQRFGLLGGIALADDPNALLVSATELTTSEAIAQYGRALAQFCALGAAQPLKEDATR
ncbi:MAG: aminomethyl-transferring glycine dehydrogenase subunit GcvPA [Vampirovibrionales bacterium]|nr:aminomethyl-transferring glycine dehydrogenase subunit GcvPA [Vampirovibrionales bacterium]